MKKDLNWLKEEVQKLPVKHHGFNILRNKDEFMVDGDEVLSLIDRLDELEVLSWEWIDENKKDSGVHYIGYYVPIGRLHDLLVPKQEVPVIPQFVAEWIEGCNWKLEKWKLPSTFRSNVKYKADQRLYEWANKKGNMNVFMKAILFGYEVEEEQKYYVMNNENELILGWSQSAYMTPCIEGYEYMKHNGRENLFQLTEQEIKDYDPRYWAFAVKVEELEE